MERGAKAGATRRFWPAQSVLRSSSEVTVRIQGLRAPILHPPLHSQGKRETLPSQHKGTGWRPRNWNFCVARWMF